MLWIVLGGFVLFATLVCCACCMVSGDLENLESEECKSDGE